VSLARVLPADLRPDLDAIAKNSSNSTELLDAIVALFHERLTNYNWVGFYLLEENSADKMLVLGPFRGAPTPHTRIPLNQGICGAAAASGETLVVDDVNADPRYLSCSIETKSEIVVPIFAGGRVIGELDIDSHAPAAFGGEDRALCEYAAKVVGDWYDRCAG
jgi:L-methionine (R)-S-oxide reductase